MIVALQDTVQKPDEWPSACTLECLTEILWLAIWLLWCGKIFIQPRTWMLGVPINYL